MTLLELRRKLVELSGKYDLVTDTTSWADNGADFFLNAGQRWLDRKLDDKYSVRRSFKKVEAGAIGVVFEWCRVILQVWVQETEEGTRTLLEKKSPTWIREEYDGLPDVLTSGTPLYYHPAFLRIFPHNPTIADIQTYLGFADVTPMQSEGQIYDGVIFMPPTDKEYVVEVWGHFYSPQLLSETQESYWSVRAPEALLMSALRMIEVFHRNTEGVKDWEYAVKEQLADLDKDSADEGGTDVIIMEG